MKTKKNLIQGFRILVLALVGILMLFPFIWMLVTSFKQGADVFNLSLLPSSPTLKNYENFLAAVTFHGGL